MKRWIHAATENIDQKIKDYLAAWAHDNVKAGEEACSLKDFRSELKDKGLKYTDSRYDYYLQCYNHMNKAKNGSDKKVNASTDTRDRISYLEDRIDQLTQYIDECKATGCDLDEFVDEMVELEELKEQLNFAWQDDEEEYNYALEQQEFNPDGSLKFYGSDFIKASTLWDNGWSKRYNKEIGETYFVFTCPKATAYVFQSNDKDDNGEYNSSAEVGFSEDLFKNKIKKSFFGRGSEFDAMTWAEHVIFDENIDESTQVDESKQNVTASDDIDSEYERIQNLLYDDGFLDSYDGTPLIGWYWAVKRKDDDEGWDWRAFTNENWEKVRDMSDEEIYNKYPASEVNKYSHLVLDGYGNITDTTFNKVIGQVNHRTRSNDLDESLFASTDVTASSDIVADGTIQEGMIWYQDGFTHVVTKVSPDHKTCEISDSWIAEDTGRPQKNVETYNIKVVDGEERACNPVYPDFGFFASNATNYPYEYTVEDDPYSEDYEESNDDYTPSATAGDYSPSNPWDAPGMSIKDFI